MAASDPTPHVIDFVDDLYRAQSRRVFATLVRLLGDFDLAEEALHEAFTTAVEKWEKDGVPTNPEAWLVSTGRFKAIDAIRRRARFDESLPDLAHQLQQHRTNTKQFDEAGFRDDQLRLIFTCCHPALAQATQIALTLREVCGLKTEEVGSAFLTSPSTIAQRIVRGKAKIRTADIPYEVPGVDELPSRLESVLSVVYLVFNEGYSASRGEAAIRRDLASEAIRLGRILLELLPDAEVLGLLALMLLHDSRRDARTTIEGDIVLMEDQDRTLWNREQIAEGSALVGRALAERDFGSYTIQAAIAAVHANSPSGDQTDWGRIIALYDLLMRAAPSPVVELNRSVAISMRDGPEAGLNLIDAILARGDLADYHLSHSARADLCRQLDRSADAKVSYERALALANQEPERRYLKKRLQQLD